MLGGGWVVGGWWFVGGVLFFVHTPVQRYPYNRATRGQASLRSKIVHDHRTPIGSKLSIMGGISNCKMYNNLSGIGTDKTDGVHLSIGNLKLT